MQKREPKIEEIFSVNLEISRSVRQPIPVRPEGKTAERVDLRTSTLLKFEYTTSTRKTKKKKPRRLSGAKSLILLVVMGRIELPTCGL